MTNAIRTTVVFAFVAGVLVPPLMVLLNLFLPWTTCMKLIFWGDIAIYGVLLARWNRTALLQIFFPLFILIGVAFWPGTYGGFWLMALGVLSWIRSGICFKTTTVRLLTAEIITLAGGAGTMLLLGAHDSIIWALNICLFFLVQSLYLFIVPQRRDRQERQQPHDRFEQAALDAVNILDGTS